MNYQVTLTMNTPPDMDDPAHEVTADGCRSRHVINPPDDEPDDPLPDPARWDRPGMDGQPEIESQEGLLDHGQWASVCGGCTGSRERRSVQFCVPSVRSPRRLDGLASRSFMMIAPRPNPS